MNYTINAFGYLCLTAVIIALAKDDSQQRAINAGPDATRIFDAGYTTGVHDTVQNSACPPGPHPDHSWEQRPHA
jgi:hypothetical protein